MKSRKWYLVVLAVVLLLFLVACGETSNDVGSEPGKDENIEDEVIKLTFWGGIPEENGPLAAVEKWNKMNPHIQVEYVRYVNDEEGNLRVNTALQTNQGIDILMSHGVNDYEQRVESGFLLDLSDRIDDDFILNNIGDGATKWKIDGKYYALPTNINAIFIMLNEEALEAKGLEIPETLTWDELRDYAIKLKDGKFKYTYALDADNVVGIIQNALIDDGFVKEDGTSNLDHPNVKKGLEIYYQMMHEDQVMPILAEQKATNMAVDQMFLNGEIAMYQAGAWRLRSSNNLEEYPRDFTIAFVPYPYFEGQSIPAHHIEDAMSIVATTEHPEEAWEFIQWYAKEGMLELAPGGRVPALKDAPQAEARKMIIQGAEDTYNVDSLNSTYEVGNTKMLPFPPYQVLDNINAEIEKYFLGEQDIDTTIQNMVDFHNDFLERSN